MASIKSYGRSFTLIELLTVLSIVAILCGLLLAAFEQVRNQDVTTGIVVDKEFVETRPHSMNERATFHTTDYYIYVKGLNKQGEEKTRKMKVTEHKYNATNIGSEVVCDELK